MNTQIAVLLTCFNRRQQTTTCLQRLFDVLEQHNNKHKDKTIDIAVFLTDDGCIDGTADAVKAVCQDRELYIIQGNGHLYWAGGMRIAWRKALETHQQWHYYLLLNDDTIVCDNVFEELLDANDFALKEYGCQGIYSGITSTIDDDGCISYGGDIFASQARAKATRAIPMGVPQMVDMTTANILLVPHEVVDKIGILADGYIHGGADNDYSMMARRNGIPALVTAHVCGRCDYDHESDEQTCRRLSKMSLAERLAYIKHPLHSDNDYLLLIRRNNRKKYPISWTLRKLRVFFPSLYIKLNKMRGIY